jgi:hypothetical protein
MNLRSVTAASGEVGSGVGQMARGNPVPSSGDLFRFFAKVRREAKIYMRRQLRAQKDAGKLPNFVYPISANTDEKKEESLWACPDIWTGGFKTTTWANSTAAQKQKQQNGPAAGSIAAADAAAAIAAHTGANAPVTDGTVVSGDEDQDQNQANAA